MSSFGETLKRERESRQISLREISEATKINIRYLDALERNEFRHLPGGVFNKGFVRAFAQFVGVDPEAMVAAYLQELREQESRAAEGGRDVPRRARGASENPAAPAARPPSPAHPKGAKAWMLIGGALILLAAGVGVGFGLTRFLPRARRIPQVAGEEPVKTVPQPPSETAPANTDAAGSQERAAPETANEARTPPESPPAAVPAGQETAANPPPGENPTLPSPGGGTVANSGFDARILIARSTSGIVRCDGRLVGALDALPEGKTLDVHCAGALVFDVDDGGAVRVGINGAEPVALGADGMPLHDHRVGPSVEGQNGARRQEP